VPRLPVLYRTLAEELDAVQSRRKAMSVFGTYAGRMPEFEDEILEQAFVRGLSVFLVPAAPDRRVISIFVLYPENAWRVLAHAALYEALEQGDGWSRTVEALQSSLFGYTKAQRADWLRMLDRDRPSEGMVHALLSRAQRRIVTRLGMRSFGPPEVVAELEIFAHPTHSRLKADAYRRVPRGTTLARVAIRGDLHGELFYRRDPRRVGVHKLTIAQAERFNGAQRTNIQFLTARGWS
jgi:hypothetical protein